MFISKPYNFIQNRNKTKSPKQFSKHIKTRDVEIESEGKLRMGRWYMVDLVVLWRYGVWCSTLNPAHWVNDVDVDDNCRRLRHAQCDGAWNLFLSISPLGNPQVSDPRFHVPRKSLLPLRGTPGDVCLLKYVMSCWFIHWPMDCRVCVWFLFLVCRFYF